MAIKKGDTVYIRSGKDRGKSGKVSRVFPKKGLLTVEGVNVQKKHQRTRKSGQKGQILTREMPIRVSAALLFCGACGRGVRTRAGRVCVKCAKTL